MRDTHITFHSNLFSPVHTPLQIRSIEAWFSLFLILVLLRTIAFIHRSCHPVSLYLSTGFSLRPLQKDWGNITSTSSTSRHTIQETTLVLRFSDDLQRRTWSGCRRHRMCACNKRVDRNWSSLGHCQRCRCRSEGSRSFHSVHCSCGWRCPWRRYLADHHPNRLRCRRCSSQREQWRWGRTWWYDSPAYILYSAKIAARVSTLRLSRKQPARKNQLVQMSNSGYNCLIVKRRCRVGCAE